MATTERKRPGRHAPPFVERQKQLQVWLTTKCMKLRVLTRKEEKNIRA